MPHIAATNLSMTNLEKRATFSLASIFALRMFGLFMIMPVFSIYAENLAGGQNKVLVGLSIGIYGLAQAVFYFPYGLISDYIGRKPVIIFGLTLFFIGSIVAASASSIVTIIIGRSLQGAGAISSVVTAFLADLTQEHNRSKAMAVVGASIGISFGVAIISAPIICQLIGLNGLFLLIAFFSLLAIAVVIWVVPEAPRKSLAVKKKSMVDVLKNMELWRLNYGVFVLHASQTALFLVLPHRLIASSIPLDAHWYVYLPVITVSFLIMYPLMTLAEKRGLGKQIMMLAIGLILIAQLSFAFISITMTNIIVSLLIYFVGFNLLEAMQPAWITRLSPASQKGTAMGLYNTSQALGFFAGGVIGGSIIQALGTNALFISCAILSIIWLTVQKHLTLINKS